MKVSVIIPLYKDLVSLKFVLEALERQTYKNFEVIITEDDDAKESIDFLKQWQDRLEIIHLQQPDTGRNKVIAQNKAIAKSNGEYLIFIDGDIILFCHFIEYSLMIARPKRVLAGRRVNLPQDVTREIKEGKRDIFEIEQKYWKFFLHYFNDREIRAEQGIELHPHRFLYKLLSKRKRNTEILGCNFSCFKEDIIAINGFDEDFHPLATLADDTDLTWRFKGMSVELYSAKNIACCFHLWHPLVSNNYNPKEDIKLFKFNQQENNYKCSNGVDQYI